MDNLTIPTWGLGWCTCIMVCEDVLPHTVSLTILLFNRRHNAITDVEMTENVKYKSHYEILKKSVITRNMLIKL